MMLIVKTKSKTNAAVGTDSKMITYTKDNFTRQLARGRLLVPFLERYDEWDQAFDFKYTTKEVDDAWHPSGDCIPSAIDLYARTLKKEREKHSPGLQRAFLVGHFWHQAIQVVLQRMEFASPESIERKGVKSWGSEFVNPDGGCLMKSKPYHWACGSGDVAPLVLPGGWEGILDIKTMRKDDFETAYKTGKLPYRFSEKYEAQINVYMDFFDQEHAMILGVNKDSPHNFCEFVFDRDQEMIDTIYHKWQYVSECIDNGTPPIAEADDVFTLNFKG